MHAFSATIRKIDINPYVRVPVAVVRALHPESIAIAPDSHRVTLAVPGA